MCTAPVRGAAQVYEQEAGCKARGEGSGGQTARRQLFVCVRSSWCAKRGASRLSAPALLAARPLRARGAAAVLTSAVPALYAPAAELVGVAWWAAPAAAASCPLCAALADFLMLILIFLAAGPEPSGGCEADMLLCLAGVKAAALLCALLWAGAHSSNDCPSVSRACCCADREVW